MIAAIAPNNSKERFTGLGVRVIEGEARFTDANTVAVGEQFEIKARRFVIATGSAPAVPPIPGLDQTPYLTNETVFEVRERPKHLIVIGAGPIGLELAQAFRRLGSDVTVLEAAQPLAKRGSGVRRGRARPARARGRRRSAAASRSRSVKRVRTKIEVGARTDETEDEETIEGSDLLVATGRRPSVEGLGLDAAGIKHSAVRHRRRQAPAHHQQARLCHRRRYRIGAVHPRRQLSRRPGDPARAVPHAGQGRSERHSARDLHRSRAGARWTVGSIKPVNAVKTIRVLRWPYHENDRAQAERETSGHIKVITDKKGKILGATIVGASRRRIDHRLDTGDQPGAQYPCFRRNCGALSDVI